MTEDLPRPVFFLRPGVSLVLLAALISGVSTFVNIYAVRGTSSDAFVTVRNISVAAALLPLAWVAGAFQTPRREIAPLVIVGLIGGAIPFLLFFRGIQLATEAHGGATASFVYRTLFLMATVFGVVALRERVSVRTFLGASLLLAGNFLLLSLVSPLWTPGFVYVLAATILWAAEYTLSKRLLTKLPAATVALGRMGFGGLFLAGYLTLTAQWAQVGGFSGAQWEWVGLSAVLLTAFVLAWYHGLRRVDLGPATSVLVLGFPITWTLSVLVSGSAFTVAQVAGAALVAGGAIVFVLAPVARSASRLRSSAASPE